MHQNNINKIACIKIASTRMTLVKSILKKIYQMIIFLAKTFKIYQTLCHKIYQHLSAYFDKVK